MDNRRLMMILSDTLIIYDLQTKKITNKTTLSEDYGKRPITKYIEKGSKVLSTLEPFSIYILS